MLDKQALEMPLTIELEGQRAILANISHYSSLTHFSSPNNKQNKRLTSLPDFFSRI